METVVNINHQLNSLIDCEYDDIVSDISLDSRKISKGSMFVALQGEKTNGENFIDQAIALGANFVLKYGPQYKVYKKDNCVFIEDAEPKRLLAAICNKFYPNNINCISAITGTNGKTSTADFLRQIWIYNNYNAASIGTLGILKGNESPTGNMSMTSPDQVALNQALCKLDAGKIDHVVLEASSHGIAQYRMLGLKFTVVAFTNLSQDHLDYHKNMHNYFAVKSRLFTQEYISKDTKCVINIDSDKYDELANICYGPIITYGLAHGDFCFEKVEISEHGYHVALSCFGKTYDTRINVLSHFQLYNILCAVAMAYAGGMDIHDIVQVLPKLRDVKGRMQYVGIYNGGKIYVDYAHTPDGLQTAINDVKSHTKNKVIVVFGCGGNRDKAKRPMMGKVASKMADVVFVTDDNPRNEAPEMIRSEIIAKCPKAINIGDRHMAIKAAVNQLSDGDSLLIAGKGHENYQITNDGTVHFDDAEEVLNCIKMFSSDEINNVLGSNIISNIYGISIDSRTVQNGDLYIAIKGEHFDGNNFVDSAIENGATAAICEHYNGNNSNVIVVKDSIEALQKLGIYARYRYNTNVIGITGSVGKSSTKNMLSLVLGHFSKTFSSIKNFNSQIGVPICLSMIPESANNAVIEMGMSHANDLNKLIKIADPDISIITNVSESHQGFFSDLSQIAIAKAEIFSNGENQKYTIIPGDSACTDILKTQALSKHIKNIYTFGTNEDAHARIISVKFGAKAVHIEAEVLNEYISYNLYTMNYGTAHNSLIPLICAKLEGYDLNEAAEVLSEEFRPLPGRGELIHLKGNSLLIDDAYNASPASMSEAILSLKNYGDNVVKIAILGDMGELGNDAEHFHTALADKLSIADYVYLCGQNMRELHKKLPDSCWYENINDLMQNLVIPSHSVVLVKASRFMRFDKIVNYIKGANNVI